MGEYFYYFLMIVLLLAFWGRKSKAAKAVAFTALMLGVVYLLVNINELTAYSDWQRYSAYEKAPSPVFFVPIIAVILLFIIWPQKKNSPPK